MSDILYVRRNGPRRGPARLLFVLLILAVIGGFAYWFYFKKLPVVSEPSASETTTNTTASTNPVAVVATNKPAASLPSKKVKSAISNASAADAVSSASTASAAKVVVAQPENTVPNPAAEDLIRQAQELMAADQLLDARAKLFQVLDSCENTALHNQAEKLLGELHIKLVFSPRSMPEKVEYTVQRGDSLDGLAKKFHTTRELIAKGNNITGSIIREADRYKILNGTFTASVSKTRNDLVLRLNDRFFKRYLVGTGQYQKTPVGRFQVMDRVAQPVWWRPDGKRIPYGDPENLLGTHWLSLDVRGYGIHGTWETNSVGKQSSAGCVRLLNPDVEELYYLLPIGTVVEIQE